MICFIVNPVSGKGNGLNAAKKIKDIMTVKNIPYKILETKNPGHGEVLSAQCIKHGAKTVVAVGGDGTALEVVRGFYDENKKIINKDVSFGIIPIGSGNDFVKCLNVPKDIEKAVDIIIENKTFPCDIIKANGQFALNIICLGIDAEIAGLSYFFKKISPKFSYVLAALVKIFTYKSLEAEIHANGEIIKGKFTIIAMANGKYYGGGFKIAPEASLSDGKFTLVYAEKIPWYKLLVFMTMVPKGRHVNLKEVTIINCDKITVKYNKKHTFIMDGNITPAEGIVKAEMLHKAVNVIHNTNLRSMV